jgi:CMP-N-acetylneuraminic acid synthetase
VLGECVVQECCELVYMVVHYIGYAHAYARVFCIMYCVSVLFKAADIVQAYEILIYVSMHGVFVCCTLCCTPSLPSARGGGGRGLAIADSHHKLDIIGVK